MPALRTALCEPLIPSATQPPGTYVSGPIANAGYAAWVNFMVHASAMTGAGATLDAHLDSSPDGITWTAIPGSSIYQITAAGNFDGQALVNNEYARVSATVGGTSTTVTFAAAVLVIPV